MTRETLSTDSIAEATRDRSQYSGHGNAKGSAGYRTDGDIHGTFLNRTGETAVINPHKDGTYGHIHIGASWDNVRKKDKGFFRKLLRKKEEKGVDIDLGCLYELSNGERGAIQAFGNLYGALDNAPHIAHSGDERTGNKRGEDEYLEINGAKWGEIKRILLYVYIYNGSRRWAEIRPEINIDIAGESPLLAIPSVHKENLSVCAVAGLENVRGGIKITNYSEYFPGHAEMDRAFGFGLQWDDGKKG